jgi:multisubunit Na+/H+ antiporter MnhB subunit
MFMSRRVARTEGASYRVADRAPWSPAQLIVAIAGIVFIVLGGVALARAGVHFDNVPFTRTQVAGLWFTNMSALITLVVGVLMLAGAIDPDGAKATMWLFGVVLIAFGLIVAISPQPFTNMWGFHSANGVFYVVVGAILLLAGAISPVFYSSRRRVVSQRGMVDDDGVPPTPVGTTSERGDRAASL